MNTGWKNHSLLSRANAFLSEVGNVAGGVGAEEALEAAFTGYTIVQSDPSATNWARIMAAGGHLKVADRWERAGRSASNSKPNTVRPGSGSRPN